MPSKQPHSTVSFNTEAGLKTALHLARPEFWFYVKHHPENGRYGDHKKEHFHVYMDFGRSIDPARIRDYFVEAVDGGKPLNCLPLKPSKFEDAFLYFIHDECYLRVKGQPKEFHYATTDLVTNDPDMLNDLMAQIDYAKYQRSDYLAIVEKAYDLGVRDFGTLIVIYRPPISQYNMWQKLWIDYTSYRAQLEKDPHMRCNTSWAELATERSHMRLEAKMEQQN